MSPPPAACPTRWPSTGPAARSRPPSPAALGDRLERLYAANAVPGPYSPDAGAAGRRALRGRALALLTALDPEAALRPRPVRRGRTT